MFNTGSSFEDLAITFSDDPPAKEKLGALGWINWGNVPYDFQKAAFTLPLNTISSPVLTEFGYHLILVTDKKPSIVSGLSLEALEEKAYSATQRIVGIDRFRSAAATFDSLAISDSGLLINEIALNELKELYDDTNKTNKITPSGKTNPIPVIERALLSGPLFVFNNKGFGPLWFANELSRLTPSQRPDLSNINSIKNSIEVIILRKVAISKGYDSFVDKTFSYRTQYKSKLNDMVYEHYLKDLMNSVKDPTEKEVLSFYKKNINLFYSAEKVSVRELRVQNKALADSLFMVLNDGVDFIDIAKRFSITNPAGGGLVEPFSKGKYNEMGVAAFSTKVKSFSNIVSNLDNSFSIVYVEKIIPPTPMSVEQVGARIKTSIVRSNQEKIKKEGVRGLLKSYPLWIDPSFFNIGLINEKF